VVARRDARRVGACLQLRRKWELGWVDVADSGSPLQRRMVSGQSSRRLHNLDAIKREEMYKQTDTRGGEGVGE
jgi:hypothetical protein